MTGLEYGRLAPEIVLLAGALVALLGGSFLPRTRQHLVTPFALAALVGCAAVAVLQAGAPTTVFDGTWALDAPTLVLRVAAPLACTAVLLLGARERAGSPRESETVALLLLATLGAVVLGAADDLLLVVTGYLLASIPLYGLIGLGRTAKGAEAALKTYLQGALFGVVLLGGVAVLAALAGGTDYARFAVALPQAPVVAVAIGAVAVVVALLFEAGAVPAHFWVPDATQASSRQTAAFLTTVPKLAGLVALLRLVEAVRPALDLAPVVGAVAAASMLLGTFAAFTQDDVRRLLGWSTVAQAGFLLLAVAAVPQASARPALLLYLVAYAAANLSLFAAVAALPAQVGLQDWRGASRRHPVLVGVVIVGLLALVGTPPTGVLLGKLAVLQAAWSAGEGWLVLVAAVATVASLFYSLRWIGAAFAPPAASAAPARAEPLAAATAVVLAVLTLAFAALAPLLALA